MINITFDMFVAEILRLLAGEGIAPQKNRTSTQKDKSLAKTEITEIATDSNPGTVDVPPPVVEAVVQELCEIVNEQPHPYHRPSTSSLRWLYNFMNENSLMDNLFPEDPNTNRYPGMNNVVGMSREDLNSTASVSRMSIEGREKRRAALEEMRREREAVELQNRFNRQRAEQRLRLMLTKDLIKTDSD
jgi:hypothetical protein